MANLAQMSTPDLQKRIETLKSIQEDTALEEAELKKRLPALVAASAKAKANAPETAVTYEEIPIEVEVDKASFDSGGEILEGPGFEIVCDGLVWRYIKANKKENQEFFIFKTNDDRIVAKKGRNICSGITITPRAVGNTPAGAFNLARLLVDLAIPFEEVNREGSGGIATIKFNLPKGKPCKLDYQNQTFNQKTEVRLVRAFIGEVQQAV